MRILRPSVLLASLLLLGCPDLPDGLVTIEGGGIDGWDLADPGPGEEVLVELPVCTVDVLGAFTEQEVQPPAAGSDGWMAPEADTLAAIGMSVQALLDGSALVAVGQVAVVGYTLCRGKGDQSDLALWRPASPGTGRALFAWRVGGASSLVVEAPHAWSSPETMAQAVTLFDSTSARALIAAGSHPCASTATVSCGGTTTACGDQASASDPTHNEATVFHVAHRMTTERHPEAWVLSLQALDGDGVSISNGTEDEAAPGTAAAAIGAALMDAMSSELVTSCNDFEGAVLDGRTCGQASIQARHLDGAEDVCAELGAASTGRYVRLAESARVQQRALTVTDAVTTALLATGR